MNRKQWIEEAKAKAARWDSKLSEMEARLSSKSDETRAEYHKMAASARERLGKAKAQVARAEEAGADAWNDIKDKVEETWKENTKQVNETLETLAQADEDSSSESRSGRENATR